MGNMLVSWKTSLAGSAAILSAMSNLLTMFSSGHIDTSSLTTNVGIIAAGVAGLMAKDSNVTGTVK